MKCTNSESIHCHDCALCQHQQEGSYLFHFLAILFIQICPSWTFFNHLSVHIPHFFFFLIPKQFCIRLRHPTTLKTIVIQFKSLLCWEFSLHVLQGELCCFVVQLASLQRVPGEQHKVELNGSLIGPIDLKSNQPIMNIKV